MSGFPRPDQTAPTGPAGGDLGGNYPNPGVLAVNGTVVSAFIQTLLDDADAITARTTLGAAPRLASRTAGLYYTTLGLAQDTLAMTDQELYFTVFESLVTQSFDRIGAYVVTLGAGSVVRLGIYADDGTMKPGALMLDAGTIDTSASSATFREININQQLTPGIYWLAAVRQGGAGPILRGWAGPGSLAPAPISGFVGATAAECSNTSAPTGYYLQAGVAGALPTPATPVLNTATRTPRVVVRAA